MGSRDRVIPDWIYGSDPSGQLRPGTAGKYQRGSRSQVLQAPVIAEDSVIPIIYGGPERIAGMAYTTCLASNGEDLLMSLIICEGEVASIDAVEVNDQPAPDGVTWTAYTGTQAQGVDPDLAAAIVGYNESHPGTAYIVVRFPPAVVQGVPRVTVEVMGLLIPDPRAGGALGPWTNPALILAHFMSTYARRAVNAASVIEAADFCDALVSDEARSTLTLTLVESRNADEWIEVLRGYLPAWVVYKDGEWHIVCDTVSAPVFAYDADTDNRTDSDAPMALFKRGVRDSPNVVEVAWTDTSVKPWKDGKAVAQLPGLGVGQRRKAAISMPGIRRYSQAYRFAVERLNHFTLETIEGEVAVMDEGIAMTPGDIVTITDSAHGWLDKEVRVLRVDERDNGRWGLRFREFNAGAYSTEAPATPAPPDSGTLPNPTEVPALAGLTAAETLKFELESIDKLDGLARGLIWQSRIVASWTPATDPFLDYYEVRLQGTALAQPSVTTSKLAQFCSGTLVQGTQYEVSVRIINSLGFAGPWASVTVPVLGKVTPPGDVTILDFAAEIGGEAILRWRPVPDVDVVRYEWRGLATTAETAPWETMAVIDRPDTNYTRIKGIQPGQTLLAIKAIDSVGRYSVNPLYVSLIITSDAGAFLSTFDFNLQVATSTHLAEWNFPLEEAVARPLPRYITKGNAVWNAAMPNPVASQNTPVVVAFGRNAAWVHRTQAWDFGLVLEATIQLNLTWLRSLRGNPLLYLVTSVDGTNWDYSISFPINQGAANGWKSVKVTARFVKVEIFSNADTDSVMQEGPINAQVSSNARTESGASTSSASVATRINLAQKYTKAVSITITPQGTSFATASYNNVTVGTGVTPNYFEVWLFNASGQPISQPFSWTFRGV